MAGSGYRGFVVGGKVGGSVCRSDLVDVDGTTRSFLIGSVYTSVSVGGLVYSVSVFRPADGRRGGVRSADRFIWWFSVGGSVFRSGSFDTMGPSVMGRLTSWSMGWIMAKFWSIPPVGRGEGASRRPAEKVDGLRGLIGLWPSVESVDRSVGGSVRWGCSVGRSVYR